MRKNETGGGGDPKGEKSISGVTEVLGKQLSKNILTIPLQSCSLLYYNTHVHAHRLTKRKKKKAVGEVMKIITSTLLMTGWTNQVKNTLNSLKPQQAS